MTAQTLKIDFLVAENRLKKINILDTCSLSGVISAFQKYKANFELHI